MPIIYITTKCGTQELIKKKKKNQNKTNKKKKTKVCPCLTSIKFWLHKTEDEMYKKEQNISNLQWQD